MAVNVTNAIEAFNRAARLVEQATDGPAAAQAPGEAGSFARLMRTMANDVVETSQKAEATTAQAVAGNADLTEVVQAVTNAEVTLQAVVAVRDRVVNAYQEIMRMPI